MIWFHRPSKCIYTRKIHTTTVRVGWTSEEVVFFETRGGRGGGGAHDEHTSGIGKASPISLSIYRRVAWALLRSRLVVEKMCFGVYYPQHRNILHTVRSMCLYICTCYSSCTWHDITTSDVYDMMRIVASKCVNNIIHTCGYTCWRLPPRGLQIDVRASTARYLLQHHSTFFFPLFLLNSTHPQPAPRA